MIISFDHLQVHLPAHCQIDLPYLCPPPLAPLGVSSFRPRSTMSPCAEQCAGDRDSFDIFLHTDQQVLSDLHN